MAALVRTGVRGVVRACGSRGVRPLSTATSIYTPSEEHGALRDMVRQFAEAEVEPQAIEFNREEKFNRPLFDKCGELGLLGVTVGEEYGGSGMDAVAAVIVHEELSAVDPAFTLSYLAHSMLFVNNLFHNGSEEQKQRFLPGACSGSIIGGMAMSEPAGGTDVLGMNATAKPDGDDWVLNGSKMWITNGGVADGELGDVFLVYARTGEG
jgi:isovaleryl-CoA dehydrogenase